tara:strand:- start:6011 stop:6811 length:801 start_codon:yes stop_codon:yes gene_type:complete
MKVALCLSGLMRDFETSGASYNEFICNHLKADVFVHTWKENAESSNTRFSSSKMSDVDDKRQFFTNTFPNSKVSFCIEDFNSDWNFRKNFGNNLAPRTTAIMYYSIYKSNLLKTKYEENNDFVYDIVIRARMDFLMKQNIDMSELLECCGDDKVVYVGTNLFHKGPTLSRMNWDYGSQFGVEDQFAFGSSHAMNKYSSCYLKQNNMQYEGGEITLGRHFMEQNLIPKRTKFRFKSLQFAEEHRTVYWEDYDKFEQTIFKKDNKNEI